MSKTGELFIMLEELRNAEASLHSAVDTLADLLSAADGSVNAPKATEKALTLADLRAVLAEKSMQGYTAKVQALIHKHGAEKLSQVDPAEYASLLAEAEAL